jgi:hypothetical protein
VNNPKNKVKISFHLQPYKFEENLHAVEKSDEQGIKHRYLRGLTSGMKVDGHGERMTKKCVDDMEMQARKGCVLLYEGQHGVTYTDDLGVLVESNVKLGEWDTLYRLYDETDGFEPGGATLERADKLWKQVNGLPPYVDKQGNPAPKQKGFSIEGYIPDNGIIELSDDGKRVIDKVDLDGVLVTPRPSYKDSVITAVYKALDELPPDRVEGFNEHVRKSFMDRLDTDTNFQTYYNKRFKLDDALNESIQDIMERGTQIRDRLKLVFDQYSNLVIELLVEHAGVFKRPPDQPDIPEQGAVDVAKMQKINLLKNIEGQLSGFVHLKKTKPKKK